MAKIAKWAVVLVIIVGGFICYGRFRVVDRPVLKVVSQTNDAAGQQVFELRLENPCSLALKYHVLGPSNSPGGHVLLMPNETSTFALTNPRVPIAVEFLFEEEPGFPRRIKGFLKGHRSYAFRIG